MGFGGYSEGGGEYVKNRTSGGVRKKSEFLGGYENLSRHGKITFYQCCHSKGDPLTVGDYCFL